MNSVGSVWSRAWQGRGQMGMVIAWAWPQDQFSVVMTGVVGVVFGWHGLASGVASVVGPTLSK